MGLDHGLDPSAHVEISDHLHADWVTGPHKIVQYLVHRVFVEDAHIAVKDNIFLEGFQFHAIPVWDIADGDGGEVGGPCFGANAGEFRDRDLNRVISVRVLIGPRVDSRGLQTANMILKTLILSAFHLTFLRNMLNLQDQGPRYG